MKIMNKTVLAIILAVCASSIPLHADEAEKLPESAKPNSTIEQPDFKATAPQQEKKLPPAATPAGWTDSLKDAITRAKTENKYIMALFTGSDWCEYCYLAG